MATSSTTPHVHFSWLRRYTVTIVLMVAYIAMTVLVIEQGRTIESQKTLIRLLFSDSAELSAMKIKQARERHSR